LRAPLSFQGGSILLGQDTWGEVQIHFPWQAQSFRGAVLRANCGRIAAQRMLHELSWELTATVLKSIGC